MTDSKAPEATPEEKPETPAVETPEVKEEAPKEEPKKDARPAMPKGKAPVVVPNKGVAKKADEMLQRKGVLADGNFAKHVALRRFKHQGKTYEVGETVKVAHKYVDHLQGKSLI